MAKNKTQEATPEIDMSIQDVELRISFTRPNAEFGFKINAGDSLSFSDPNHQKLITIAFKRVLGAKVEFIPVSARAIAAAHETALKGAHADLTKAKSDLAMIEASRVAEIAKLNQESEFLKTTAVKNAQEFNGPTPERQLEQFMASEDGVQMVARQKFIAERILTVNALMAAARGGTDDTIAVSKANSAMIDAKKRLAQLATVSAGASPVGAGTGPADPTGEATA